MPPANPISLSAMQQSDALQKVLLPLSAAPSGADMETLDALQRALEILAGIDLKPLQRHKILELFLLRASQIQSVLTDELQAATLPMPMVTRLHADRLINILGLLAQGILTIAATASAGWRQDRRNEPPHAIGQAMQCWHRQIQISALIGAPAPSGLWQLALGALHRTSNQEAKTRLGDEFSRMLALTVAQPESFTPRELTFLIDYLQGISPPLTWLTSPAPLPPNTYWLDPVRHLPPHALARRRPPPLQSAIFFFDCTALARQAREHLKQLADGAPPATLGLPAALAAEDYRNALACAANRWSGPDKRQHGRRTGNYRVEVCAHSGTLWRLLSGDIGSVASTAPLHAASNWLVTNESPEGYAMLHVAGHCAGLRTGTALGVRHADTDEWRVCLVRWAKSENPEHVELGLELLAPTARAVRLAYRGTAAPVPALLLPALPALQRGEALLTARGHFVPGAFTLLADDTTGIRLFDCETGMLAMCTASIELFEFSRQSLLDIV